ncbi:hypothetical protein GCM10007304_12310 [Rhodococcoides trifolii]|uniref:Uncharacterized protein n=1 Tax=Rhodococcoides trifolii TaxID=908250 RepID=A0A917CVR7_9NOCA|nr:hypothetical protein GCM10007304_12310 [Rhodococcus trifolii]
MSGRHSVLYPAIVEAARRVDATAVGLIDVECGAGLNLIVDRVGISYGSGHTLGDMASPVQVSARVVGERSVPSGSIPPVVARIGVDSDPVDTGGYPSAEAELLASTPHLLLRSSVSDAIGRVPVDAIPIVTTTWALSRLSREHRLRFLEELRGASRPLAWVSAEGVGVAPDVPTLGDRPASGHSIIGVAVVDDGMVHAEAVGRCWSKGAVLSWLV